MQQQEEEKKPVMYAYGDVVKLLSGRIILGNNMQVITDRSIDDEGYVSYGVNGYAWFDFDELEFVRRADQESIDFAVSLGLNDDVDEYTGDEDDEDD